MIFNTMSSFYEKWLRKTLFPFLLISCTPSIAIVFWYTNVYLEGSLVNFLRMIETNGLLSTFVTVWKPIYLGSSTAWTMLAVYAVFQLTLMRIVPGKVFHGPETPSGNVPVYKDNGFACYLLTLVTFYVASVRFHLFSPTIIYDNFGPLLGALNVFSLCFCLFLYVKGRIAPSSSDSGSTGNFIFDYYWGTELYPRILGWDVKQFTNCRCGMMGWALIILSFAAKQQKVYGLSDSMLVAVGLQLIYITKFFIWETGYLRSLDIMHDRAGYYICWGCLVWVPSIYTSATLYLVNHPNHLGTILALLIYVVGASCILINYWADRQRQKVRLVQGDCQIWGKPAVITKARYIAQDGALRENVLLASGWWGVARHFHYIPEILGALFWTLPALFDNFIPYFYVLFLTILLFDRAFRDEKRCSNKYGDDWNVYCEKVPYKIIPYII